MQRIEDHTHQPKTTVHYVRMKGETVGYTKTVCLDCRAQLATEYIGVQPQHDMEKMAIGILTAGFQRQ